MRKIFLFFFIAFNAISAQKAKILFVRGDVTALPPKAIEAVSVKRGDVFPEQTSILTRDKSVVKIRFTDNSSINLGPNSKVVVSKLPKKEANIVNVLTGVIKSSVEKNSDKSSRTKLIVKTQSAVMGVRGTKFQASYSPKTNKTTLLTVEGEVAIAKVEKFDPNPLKEAKVDKVLDSNLKAVKVTPGKFSVTEEVISKPTEPTNISPDQFNAIANSMNSDVKASVVMNDSHDDKQADAQKDLKKDLIKYKAGGFVDFTTGKYIAPVKTAKLDKKTNTYSAPEKKVELLEDGNVKVKEIDRPSFWKKLLPAHTRVGLIFNPFSESVTVKDKDRGDAESSFYSKSAHMAGINLELIWNEKITTLLNLGGGKFEFNKEDLPFEEYGEGNFFIDLRFEYRLNELWTAIASLSSRTYRFPFEDLDPGFPRIRSEDREIDFLSLGAKRKLSYLPKHNLIWEGKIHFMGDKDVYLGRMDEENIESFGFETSLEASYNFFTSYFLRPNLWFEYSHHESDSKEFSRSRIGLKILLQKQF